MKALFLAAVVMVVSAQFVYADSAPECPQDVSPEIRIIREIR